MKSRSLVRRHETRLRRALERALLVALAAPAAFIGAQACSSDKNPASDGGVEASAGDGGITDAGSDAYVDAGPCAPHTVYIDAQAPDGGIECGVFQVFPCGVEPLAPDATLYDDCYFSLNDCPAVCPGELFFNCHVYGDNCDAGVVSEPTNMVVECATCPNGVGRKPAGLVASRHRTARTRAGEYFAKAAHLETASVHAFRILRRELVAHRAPNSLILAAKRAEADEVRHARSTAKLARMRGGNPVRARVAKLEPRSFEAMAIENAVEGCVRETYGALFAMWQAEHALDRDVARALKNIADDEARHAALSWSVAEWVETRLDAAAKARVSDAKAKAMRDLEKDADREPHPDLVKHAGLPTAASQRAMLRALAIEMKLAA